MKVNMNVVSALILGISIVGAACIVTDGLKKEKVNSNQKEEQKRVLEKQLLTTSEVAIYLGISTEEVSKLLASVNRINADGSAETEIFSVQINHVAYYSKKSIDEWLGKEGYIQID